jgi:hypothetical protein
MSAPEFTVEIFQNEYLASGAREVNAVVTVKSAEASGYAAVLPSATAAEVIIVDCSGSMSTPLAKMIKAREATAAAIDAIRDGVAFAVIAGTDGAKNVYPAGHGMAIADSHTKDAAKRVARMLRAEGGRRKAEGGRRDGDRHLAAAGTAVVHDAHRCAEARDPAHRRPEWRAQRRAHRRT